MRSILLAGTLLAGIATIPGMTQAHDAGCDVINLNKGIWYPQPWAASAYIYQPARCAIDCHVQHLGEFLMGHWEEDDHCPFRVVPAS
jgi:hypothetical protein